MDIVDRMWLWTQYLWTLMMLVWIAGMVRTRRTVRRQTTSSRLWQAGMVLLGAWLLFGKGTGYAWLDATVVPVTPAVAIAGVVILAAGIGFAVWARVTLGANWSGTVTVKEGHTLIRRGPYRIVRHPIYTGILLGLAGTALTRGTLHALLAVPVCAFGFWLKLRTEEQFMFDEFGEEYLRYRSEVRALVPYLF